MELDRIQLHITLDDIAHIRRVHELLELLPLRAYADTSGLNNEVVKKMSLGGLMVRYAPSAAVGTRKGEFISLDTMPLENNRPPVSITGIDSLFGCGYNATWKDGRVEIIDHSQTVRYSLGRQ